VLTLRASARRRGWLWRSSCPRSTCPRPEQWRASHQRGAVTTTRLMGAATARRDELVSTGHVRHRPTTTCSSPTILPVRADDHRGRRAVHRNASPRSSRRGLRCLRHSVASLACCRSRSTSCEPTSCELSNATTAPVFCPTSRANCSRWSEAAPARPLIAKVTASSRLAAARRLTCHPLRAAEARRRPLRPAPALRDLDSCDHLWWSLCGTNRTQAAFLH
jgi:hypothetical protein